jgi:hypothetical protein
MPGSTVMMLSSPQGIKSAQYREVRVVANSTNQSFTYGIGCIRCGQTLIAPEWSEYVSELCVHHAWICDDCGVRFETSDHLHFPEPRRSLQFPLVMNKLGVCDLREGFAVTRGGSHPSARSKSCT